MPINYQNGKIYKIITTNSDDIYIGSTTNTLKSRLSDHVKKFKKYRNGGNVNYMTSFQILEQDNYGIILLENYPCTSKKELHLKEREWMENNKCVNKCLPCVTYQEKKDKSKLYYHAHKEKYKQYHQKYAKTYYKINKKILKEKSKNYKNLNNIKIKCECGSTVNKLNIPRHCRSKKHIKYLNNSLNDPK